MRPAFRLFYFLPYLVFRFLETIIGLLPLDVAFKLGRAGGELGYRVLGRRRRVARKNLRLAFGREISDAEVRALNREHFQLLGANLFAGFKAATMPHAQIWKRVTAALPKDRLGPGWVALISHIGNWELFSHLAEEFPEYRFGVIYQGLANPYIDQHLQRTRVRSGISLFDRRTELLKCVRFLRDGGVVGVLVDQGAGYAGVWEPLFGRLTSSSTLAATLSIRTRLPVVPLAIYTRGTAHWKMVVSDPVYPIDQGADDETDLLTARINGLLEEQIRQSPADWLWSHNRWKPLRPHFLFARDQRRVFFPPEFDRATLDPFRILIVSPAAEKEVADMLPAIRPIKDGRPDASLTILSPSALAPLWRNVPGIDHVIEGDASASAFALASAIRNTARYDAAIIFYPSWKTSLAVWLASIPIRVGRKRGLISGLYNQHPPEPNEPVDPVSENLQIARSVGANIHPPRRD